MGRNGVSYEEVFELANALVAEQVNPTCERIRQRLGGGSFSTITRYLQAWRLHQQEHAQKPNPPDAVGLAVQQVWEGLHAATEAKIQAIQQEAQDACAAYQAKAHDEITVLQAAYDAAQAKLLQQEALSEAYRQEILQLQLALKEAQVGRQFSQDQLEGANALLQEQQQQAAQRLQASQQQAQLHLQHTEQRHEQEKYALTDMLKTMQSNFKQWRDDIIQQHQAEQTVWQNRAIEQAHSLQEETTKKEAAHAEIYQLRQCVIKQQEDLTTYEAQFNKNKIEIDKFRSQLAKQQEASEASVQQSLAYLIEHMQTSQAYLVDMHNVLSNYP